MQGQGGDTVAAREGVGPTARRRETQQWEAGKGRKERVREPRTLLHPSPPSSLLIRSPRQGDGTSGTFWPVKGQLILQGQRGSCLEAGPVPGGREGKAGEAARGSAVLSPGLIMVGLVRELHGWGWSAGQALPVQPCAPRCCWTAAPTGTAKPAGTSHAVAVVIIIPILLFFLTGGTPGRF